MTPAERMARSRAVNRAATVAWESFDVKPVAVIVVVIDEASAGVGFTGDPDLAAMVPEILRNVADAERQAMIAGYEPGGEAPTNG